MACWLYVLESLSDRWRYVGQTDRLELRVLKHQQGLVRSTKSRRPFRLALAERFETRGEAMRRERFLKSGRGRAFLDKLSLAATVNDRIRQDM